jgi:hypothetical protein
MTGARPSTAATNSRQRADRGDRVVELAPAVIGDDIPSTPRLTASRASSACKSPLMRSGPHLNASEPARSRPSARASSPRSRDFAPQTAFPLPSARGPLVLRN